MCHPAASAALGCANNVRRVRAYGLLVIPFLVWGVLSPRSLWRNLVGWYYRDLRANEPSRAGYAFNQTVTFVLLVAVVWWMATG